MRVVDLSHGVHAGLVTYPGLPPVEVADVMDREESRSRYAHGATFYISRIDMVGNTGTYIDAPFHRFADLADVAGLELSRLVDLPGIVVRVRGGRGGVGVEAFKDLNAGGRAVLVDTGAAARWQTQAYVQENRFLTEEAALALAGSGAALVGIDSLNIDDTADPRRPVHTLLLKAGIPIVENLTNLEDLPERGFRFFAPPVKAEGMASISVRAFALTADDSS